MAESRNLYTNQLSNRNFLSSVGFRFTLSRARKVSFLSNSANIPGLQLGVAVQPTYLKDIDVPGDKMFFDDFILRFIVDENLENYMQIQNWMRGLGYPETLNEVARLERTNKQNEPQAKSMDIYSDGTLQALNSNQRVQFQVQFNDMFPVALSDLSFDATNPDVEYFTAEAVFKYTFYKIQSPEGKTL